MKKYVIIIASAFFLMACANEKRPKGIGIRDDVPVVRHPVSDTITAPSVKKDVPKKSDGRGKKESRSYGGTEERTHNSSSYDNMRGFDPASEDDMEDNGMSRYMENNDEEGWN